MAASAGGRPPVRSRQLLWALAVVVVVTLLAGALAGALRAPTTMPEGTPQRTVQAYVEAIRDRDYETAASYLTPDLARRCEFGDLPPAAVREPLTVGLDDVEVDGERAEVTVRLRSDASEPPLPIFESPYREHFVLVRRDGDWLIDEDPWPVHFCDRLR